MNLPQTPTPFPELPAGHRHVLNKKFLELFVLVVLVAAAAYVGVQYWQSQQLVEGEYIPAFTPRSSGSTIDTSDWKTYTNTKYGFEVKYPNNWVLGEYQLKENFALALDPQKVVSQKTLETLDTYPGLVSINVEKCPSQGCYEVSGYDSFEKVTIGGQAGISARKLEISYEKNSSNPAYLGKHTITYYIDSPKTGAHSITITYVSDMSDKYLSDFNQILSTFNFTIQ